MSTEKTFFDEMRNYFVCFITFGLWSSWKNSKYNRLLQIYVTFFIISVASSYLLAIFRKEYPLETKLSTAIGTILLCIILVAHSVVVVETIFKSDAQLRLIQKFTFVDRFIDSKLNVSIAYDKEKCGLFRLNCCFAIVIIFFTVFNTVYRISRKQVMRFLHSAVCSSIMLRLRLIQVTVCVYLVRSRLILIKNEITNIHNEIQSHDKPDAAQPKRLDVSPAYERLLHIKQVYSDLYDITELINDIFGYSLAAIFCQTFIDFTCNGYWVYFVLENLLQFMLDNIPYDIGIAVIYINYMIPHVVMLFAVGFYCSSCYHHVRSMANSICLFP